MPSNKIPRFRVDIRPTQEKEGKEYVGRGEDLTAMGCSINSAYHPDPGATLELRLYLPGTAWPLAIERAQVTWGHWGQLLCRISGPPS